MEGIGSYVPVKGSVKDILNGMDKGIRSGLTYSGANNIEELHKNAKFIRVTQASISENGAHGVIVQG